MSATCSHEPHEHDLLPLAQLEAAAHMCAALGDPGRLRLMELLLGGRHCVSELADETGASMPSVSQRLKHLTAARLLSRTREGRHVYYELADGHVRRFLVDLFDHANE